MIETLLIILTVGTLCIVCFFVGARVGQKVARGEPVELPSVDPIRAIKEHEGKKQAQAEQDRIEAILKNIESYDGSSCNQVDIPK